MKRKQITMAQFFALVLAGASFAETPSYVDVNEFKPANDGVYEISTAKELAMFVKIVNDGKTDANARITADIEWEPPQAHSGDACKVIFDDTGLMDVFDYDGVVPCWTPIKNFSGSINGMGHTLRRFNVDAPSTGATNVGLFNQLSCGANIYNLGIDGISVSGSENVGGLAGEATCDTKSDKKISLQNVNVWGVSATATSNIGGIFGSVSANASVDMKDVHASASIMGSSNIGGLVGSVSGSVDLSNGPKPTVLDGTPNIEKYVAFAEGELECTGENAGGLFGITSDDAVVNVKDVVVAGGYLFSLSNVGGLIGSSGKKTTIDGGYVVESYIAGLTDIGGLVGLNKGTVTSSMAMGSKVGSFDYMNSRANGKALAGGMPAAAIKNVGGLVGENQGTISESYNGAEIPLHDGGENVGGIAGLNSGVIENSFNGVAISAYSAVGGVVGSNVGSVSASFNSGFVKGFDNVGGVVGSNAGSVSNSFNFAKVSGDETAKNVGSFAGKTVPGGTYTLNAYNKDLNKAEDGTLLGAAGSMDADPSGIKALSTIQFSEGAFVGFTSDPWIPVAGDKFSLVYNTSGNSVESYRLYYKLPTLPVMLGGGEMFPGTEVVVSNRKYYDKSVHISNEEDLFLFAVAVNHGADALRGVLDTNITITEGRLWTPMGQDIASTDAQTGNPVSIPNSFRGFFDGNNFSITGLTIKSESDNAGFFAKLGSDRNDEIYKPGIKNVKFVNATINGKNNVGVVAGAAQNADVEKIAVENSVVNGTSNVGGFVGAVENVVMSSNVNSFTRSKCPEQQPPVVPITAGEEPCVPQVIGDKSAVTGTGDNVGGFIGLATNLDWHDGHVNSFNEAVVKGANSVGGIVGSLTVTDDGLTSGIFEVKNSAKKVEGKDNVGGIAGSVNVNSSSTIGFKSLGNLAEVSGGSKVGGLFGSFVASDEAPEIHFGGNIGSVTGSSAAGYIGGLVGYIENAFIENFINTAKVSGGKAANVGGIVGYANRLTLSKGYNTGDVTGSTVATGSYNIGGLIGNANNAYVAKAYNAGKVEGYNKVGGIVGLAAANSGLDSLVNVAEVKGGKDAKSVHCVVGSADNSNLWALSFDEEWCTKDDTSDEYARSTEELVAYEFKDHFQWANGYASFKVENIGETPTEENPNAEVSIAKVFRLPSFDLENQFKLIALQKEEGAYNINNANQLRWFAEIVNDEDWGEYVKKTTANLVNDIVLNDAEVVPAESPSGSFSNDVYEKLSIWEPIQSFAGKFNGNGKTISGMVIACQTSDTQCRFKENVGMFDKTESGAVIDGVTLDNFFIAKLYYGGDFAKNIGGLVGYNGKQATISNSHVGKAYIKVHNNAGGLVGVNDGDIMNSNNLGDKDGASYIGVNVGSVGGIAAENNGLIAWSYNAGKMVARANGVNFGGITGLNNGTVKASFNAGVIDGADYSGNMGGLVGQQTANGSVVSSFNMGSMVSSNASAVMGGLVGDNSYGGIKYSYSIGALNGTEGATIGGIAGVYGGTMLNVYFNSDIINGVAFADGYAKNDQASYGKTSFEMAGSSFLNKLNEASGETIWAAPSIVNDTESEEAQSPAGVKFNVAFNLPTIKKVKSAIKPVVNGEFSIKVADGSSFYTSDKFSKENLASVSLVINENVYDNISDVELKNVALNEVGLNTITGSFYDVDFSFGVNAVEPEAIMFAGCNVQKTECESAKIIGASKQSVVVSKQVSVTGNVTIARSFQKGAYSTLMLPFGTDKHPTEQLAFFEINNIVQLPESGSWQVKLQAVPTSQALKANTPYVVKPLDDLDEVVFYSGEFVRNDENSDLQYKKSFGAEWDVIGTYVYHTFTKDDGFVYGYSGKAGNNANNVGKFLKINTTAGSAYINPMRLFLRYNGNEKVSVEEGMGAKTMASIDAGIPEEVEVVITEGEKTTSIGSLNTRTGKFVTNRYFDAKGRSLGQNKPSAKGSYYNKGKKAAK